MPVRRRGDDHDSESDGSSDSVIARVYTDSDTQPAGSLTVLRYRRDSVGARDRAVTDRPGPGAAATPS